MLFNLINSDTGVILHDKSKIVLRQIIFMAVIKIIALKKIKYLNI